MKNLHRALKNKLSSSIPIDYNRDQSLGKHFDDGSLGGCNRGGLGVVLDAFCVFSKILPFL